MILGSRHFLQVAGLYLLLLGRLGWFESAESALVGVDAVVLDTSNRPVVAAWSHRWC
jgi:hypothetical protein